MSPPDLPARPPARRDLLGIAGLLPAGSDAVPLSDIDGGAAFGAPAAPEQASACGTCHERCPSETLVRLRLLDCTSGRQP